MTAKAVYLRGERKIRGSQKVTRLYKIMEDKIVYVDVELYKIGTISSLALSPQKVYPSTKQTFDKEFKAILKRLEGTK